MSNSSIQLRFWIFLVILLALIIWQLHQMLLPFVAGMTLAYFLNPVVNQLTKRKVPRWLSTFVVLAGFILIVISIFTLILPLMRNQIAALLAALPGYIDTFRTRGIPWLEQYTSQFSPDDVSKFHEAAAQYAGKALSAIGEIVQNIVTSGVALFDIIALTIITPIVAFYLLRDWPKLTAAINSLLPRRYYKTIHGVMDNIDSALSGFIRGQALVCSTLGFLYSTGLSIIGLKYGVAIGVIAGLLSFIPYVGTGFGWISSVLLALVQFDDPLRVGMVLCVFIVGHILEAYLLAPRLIGHRVGLHPMWILFAILSGATLFGFSGVLIAVPVAAIIGVLIRFGITQYKSSSIYKDVSSKSA